MSMKLSDVKEQLWFLWLLHLLSFFIEFAFAFLEMHMMKIVLFFIMMFCCFEVNALHMLIVLILLLAMSVSAGMVHQSFRLIGIFLSVLLLTKMVYQTKLISKPDHEFSCTEENLTDHVSPALSDLEWLGYEMLAGEESITHLLKSYFLVLLLMTFQMVVYIRQRISRVDKGKLERRPRVMYPEVTRAEADENIENFVKFMLNYGFYKFGVEVCLSTVAFVVAYRMDVMSSVYALCLLVMFPLRRSKLSRVWTLFYVMVVLSVLWQYAMAVGLSPHMCLEYPWKLTDSLIHWLYLADYQHSLNGKIILADFFMLIIIWRQKAVFGIEKKAESNDYPGGSNREKHMECYKHDFVNPVPNQTAIDRSSFDAVKNFALISFYWVTLGFVFYTGIHNLNILSLGYLIGSFTFLWIGYDICLWHINKILKWWNLLLAYTALVILLKALYELVGCVYGPLLDENYCWLVQLLNIGCSGFLNYVNTTSCSTVGTVYLDAACFSLILFQRRLFISYYFAHLSNDAKSIFHLQSKGARFMELLMQKEIAESERKRKRTLENIKKNMNRIKKWQQKIHGPNYPELESHGEAILMGDYYMFEKSNELDDLTDSSLSQSSDEESRQRRKKKKKKKKKKEKEEEEEEDEATATQFTGTAYKKTAEDSATIHKRKETKKSVVNQNKNGEDGKNPAKENASRSGADKEDGKRDSGDKTKQDDFIGNVCVPMLKFFEKHSKDYRYINTKMKEERKFTKLGLSKSQSLVATTMDDESFEGEELLEDDEKNKALKRKKGHFWVRLLNSFSAFVMSQTEFFCYVVIFIHQVLSPFIISIPLPLFALLWGSLTTIRPTTTFWTVLIAYTEVTLLLKAIFQNLIFPWNNVKDSKNHPYDFPLLLGIHRERSYAITDLFLLLILFVHRYKLKGLGLWRKTNEEETLPPKNYGVYSEIVSGEDDEDEHFFDFENKAGRPSVQEPRPAGTRRLAKWKCTSKAMAAHKALKQGEHKTDVIVQEVEGQVLVTYKGRRLKPKFVDLRTPRPDPEELTHDVFLRVNQEGDFRKPFAVVLKLSCFQHFTPIRKFFIQIIEQKGRMPADFYTLIFFFDFLAFLLVFVGFQHFTEKRYRNYKESFYLAEEQVSGAYLFAVLVHFLIIIVDRVLYLKKNIVGKLSLQIIQVLTIHVWMFLILPKVMEASFTELIVPQIYYLIKCLHFLMSSYQMRAGYPLRVQEHFLCKKYTFTNYLCYKGLQFIPFFNQLRTVLDYCCIHSSLSIMEWIKFESMFQVIFETKCLRRNAEHYPTPRGVMFPKFKKYVPGVLAFVFLIVIVWLPYFVFAIFETVSEANLPKVGVLDVTIGSFGKIYRATASYESILPYKESDFDRLKFIYRDNKIVWSFLMNYKHEDVAILKFPFLPMESWKIRPEEFKKLNQTIQEKEEAVKLYVSWKIYRTERPQIVATASGGKVIKVPGSGEMRDEFARAFNGEGNAVFVKCAIPKFLQVNNEGNAIPEVGFFSLRHQKNAFRNVMMRLLISEDTIRAKFWEITELADDALENSTIAKIPHQDYESITIFTFNRKNIPESLLNISKRGIIGLYISIVFVMWMVVKRFMNVYPLIQFIDMPNVDRMLQLCNDIYIARESHEFALEEDLYAKLLFLFRSSETLIKWTRLRTREKGSDPKETTSRRS